MVVKHPIIRVLLTSLLIVDVLMSFSQLCTPLCTIYEAASSRIPLYAWFVIASISCLLCFMGRHLIAFGPCYFVAKYVNDLFPINCATVSDLVAG